MPTTMWEARELERLTAAKLAEAGIVALLGPRDPDTQAEIDVYALRFGPDSVMKALVECKTASPSNRDIEAINGLLPGYAGDEAVLVTGRGAHGDQIELAKKIGVKLVSTGGYAELDKKSILECDLDFASPLRELGCAVRSTYRCIGALERQARRHAEQGIIEAQKVVDTYSKVVNTILTRDPIKRASDLYELHFANQRLPQECAWAERLGPTPEKALQQAYAYGKGTYTQSALMAQTLNRCFTVAAIAERACAGSGGGIWHAMWETSATPPKAAGIWWWLSEQAFKEFVGPFMFYLVFVFGGFWPTDVEQLVFQQFHRLTGAPISAIESIIGMINDIFSTEGTDAITQVNNYPGYPWKNLILCPYPLKGVGCRFMRSLEINVRESLCRRWERSLGNVEDECEEYERAH